MLFCQQLQIQKGDEHIEHHTKEDAGQLDHNGLVIVLKTCGGIYKQKTKTAGRQAKSQKDQITLSKKLTDRGEQGGQRLTSSFQKLRIIFYLFWVEM